MGIDLNAVGRSAGPVRVGWDSTDALLYALGVGAGAENPLEELSLTTENTAGVHQEILPTYAIVLTQRARDLHIPFGEFDPVKLVHAHQELSLHRPLSVEGEVCLTNTISSIWDKGSGALVTIETRATVPDTEQPWFTSRSTVFIKGEGGFGGERGPASTSQTPDRVCDEQVIVATRPDQALLYRLSGDRNPLHSDPAFAANGDFPRPILHGMCTYGITARAVLRAAKLPPSSLQSISGRFSKPVFPGENLTISIWQEADGIRFQTQDFHGDIVLAQGVLTTTAQEDDF